MNLARPKPGIARLVVTASPGPPSRVRRLVAFVIVAAAFVILMLTPAQPANDDVASPTVSTTMPFGGSESVSRGERLDSPANDAFADATPITAVPFTDRTDLSVATVQPLEPQPCIGTGNTVWYSFTLVTTQPVSLTIDRLDGVVGVYTGTSLSDLTRVACGDFSRPALLAAPAGTTFYIQVGAWCCQAYGPATFRVVAAQNPVARHLFTGESCNGDPTRRQR